MSRTSLPIRWSAWVTVAVGLMLLAGGCRKNKEESKAVTRDGVVTAINLDTGVVEMTVFSPKANQDIAISGTLAPDCEILVNGAVATREDVKIGDAVKVTARRIKKSDTEMSFTATKVEVNRPFAETVPSAAQPEPQP